MAWKAPLEVADNLARPGSKATLYAGVCKVRTFVEHPREVPARSAKTASGISAGGPSHVKCTTIRREGASEQLDDSSVGPILQGVKAGRCLEWKDIADCVHARKSRDLMHQFSQLCKQRHVKSVKKEQSYHVVQNVACIVSFIL